MRTRNQSIRSRLIDRIDWLIDAATLGEYGLEFVGETSEHGDCGEAATERGSRRRGACEHAGSTTTSLFAIG
jgi:hypothetical protein